jgi:fatty-acyl-CoA synthase
MPDQASSSAYELLRHAANTNPGGIALTFLPDLERAPQRLTHRQFLIRVHQAANAFHRLGVRPTSIVSLLAPSVPEAFVALWGAEAAGIANPVNFLLRAEDIAAMLRATRTEVLVALGPQPVLDIWQKACAIRTQVPSLKAVVTLGPPDGSGNTQRFKTLCDQEPGDRLLSNRVIAPRDVAAYFHTGGSTGAPKIAVHTHANQVFTATALARMWHFGPVTRIVNGLPLFHVAGSLLLGLAPLSAGAEILVPTPGGLRNPQVIARHWALVEQYRPTIVGGIPTSLVALLDVPRCARYYGLRFNPPQDVQLSPLAAARAVTWARGAAPERCEELTLRCESIGATRRYGPTASSHKHRHEPEAKKTVHAWPCFAKS